MQPPKRGWQLSAKLDFLRFCHRRRVTRHGLARVKAGCALEQPANAQACGFGGVAQIVFAVVIAFGRLQCEGGVIICLCFDREEEKSTRFQRARDACKQRREIAEIQLNHVRGLLAKRNITLVLTEAATDLLIEEGYDPIYGARPLKRVLQRRVIDPLAIRVIQGDVRDGDHVVVEVIDGELEFRVVESGEFEAA